jgi:hypothetical protein
MDIKVDDKIQEKITNKINEYYRDNGVFPTKLLLGNQQYVSLWCYCFYHWTRHISEPFVLTKYMDCDIRIGYSEEIILS